MTKVKNIKVFYILFIILYLVIFISDFYRLFKNLDSANQIFSKNKYTAKIDATNNLLKIYEQPLFDIKFLNKFVSYGEWPMTATTSSRGIEIFSAPDDEVKQLLDLKESIINPPVTR